MDLQLAGRIVTITGGASGIGRATAGYFQREGARLVLADLRTRSRAVPLQHLLEVSLLRRETQADGLLKPRRDAARDGALMCVGPPKIGIRSVTVDRVTRMSARVVAHGGGDQRLWLLR